MPRTGCYRRIKVLPAASLSVPSSRDNSEWHKAPLYPYNCSCPPGCTGRTILANTKISHPPNQCDIVQRPRLALAPLQPGAQAEAVSVADSPNTFAVGQAITLQYLHMELNRSLTERAAAFR